MFADHSCIDQSPAQHCPAPTPTVVNGTKSNQGRTAERSKLNFPSRWTTCMLNRNNFPLLKEAWLTMAPTPARSRFLNPEVWENCTNLQANVNYCVEPVGSISTYPGYGATATATDPFIPTSFTPVPWVDIMANYSSANPVIPLANGTRTDCYRYDSLCVVPLPRGQYREAC